MVLKLCESCKRIMAIDHLSIWSESILRIWVSPILTLMIVIKMKNILILLMITTSPLLAQKVEFYESLGNGLQFYTQINTDPVLISHGNIISENTLPNYTKGLQFMQAYGLFNSVDEAYSYLTDNPTFFFDNFEKEGSYYNKAPSHAYQRQSYYDGGVETYNRSLSYALDENAVKDPLWELISEVRYQLVLEENYIKDSNYEFVIIHAVNVFRGYIDINSESDMSKLTSYALKTISPEDKRKLLGAVGLYGLIKEEGEWKACSANAIFRYLQDQGTLDFVKDKVNSADFYDVLSTVENGVRVYEQVD